MNPTELQTLMVTVRSCVEAVESLSQVVLAMPDQLQDQLTATRTAAQEQIAALREIVTASATNTAERLAAIELGATAVAEAMEQRFAGVTKIIADNAEAVEKFRETATANMAFVEESVTKTGAEVVEASKSIASLNEQVFELAPKIRAVEEALPGLQQGIGDQATKTDNLVKQIEEQETAVKAMAQVNEQARAGLAEQITKVADSIASRDTDLRKDFDDALAEKTEKLEQLIDAQGQVFTEQVTTAKTDLHAAIGESIDSVQGQFEEVTKQVVATKQIGAESAELMAALQQQVKEIASAAGSFVEGSATQVAEINETVSALRVELQGKFDEYVTVTGEKIEGTESNVKSIQQSVTELTERMLGDLARIQQGVVEAAADFARKQDVDALISEVNQSQADNFAAVGKQLAEASNAVEQFRTDIARTIAETEVSVSSAMENATIEAKRAIDQIRENVAADTAAIAKSVEQVESKGAEAIESLQQKLNEHGDAVGKTVDAIDIRFAEIEVAHSSGAATAAQDLEQKLNDLEENLREEFEEVASIGREHAGQMFRDAVQAIASLQQLQVATVKAIGETRDELAGELKAMATAMGDFTEAKTFEQLRDDMGKRFEAHTQSLSEMREALQAAETAVAETRQVAADACQRAGEVSTVLSTELANAGFATVEQLQSQKETAAEAIAQLEQSIAVARDGIEQVGKALAENTAQAAKVGEQLAAKFADYAPVTTLDEVKQLTGSHIEQVKGELNEAIEGVQREVSRTLDTTLVDFNKKIAGEIEGLATVEQLATVKQIVQDVAQNAIDSIAEFGTNIENVSKSVDAIREQNSEAVSVAKQTFVDQLQGYATTEQVESVSQLVQNQAEQTEASIKQARTELTELVTTASGTLETAVAKAQQSIEEVNSGLGNYATSEQVMQLREAAETNIATLSEALADAREKLQEATQLADSAVKATDDMAASIEEMSVLVKSAATAEHLDNVIERAESSLATVREQFQLVLEKQSAFDERIEQVNAYAQTAADGLAENADAVSKLAATTLQVKESAETALAVQAEASQQKLEELNSVVESAVRSAESIRGELSKFEAKLSETADTVAKSIDEVKQSIPQPGATVEQLDQLEKAFEAKLPKPEPMPEPAVNLAYNDGKMLVTLGFGAAQQTIEVPVEVGMRYRNVYRDGERYKAGDVVSHKGSGWVCNGAQTGAPGTDHQGWTLWIKKGADGYSPRSYDTHTEGTKYRQGDFLRLHNSLWQAAANTTHVPEGTVTESTPEWTLITGVQ